MSNDSYWGACPICHRCDGYVNVGSEHWCVCHEHKTKWLVGDNLFSSWRFESQEQHEKNWVRLRSYAVVPPSHLMVLDCGAGSDERDGS